MIELINMYKAYDNKILFNNVKLNIKKGEIHAITGENSVGKTILLKILGGKEQADKGIIKVKGQEYSVQEYYIKQPIKSSILFQQMCVFDELTIKENIYIHNHPNKKIGVLNFIKWKSMYNESLKYIEGFGLNLNPNNKLKYLSFGEKKLVELIRVISQGAELVLLDEPGAFLTEDEKEKIFDVMKRLKSSGTTVVFATKDIEDIKKAADNLTVIKKDGTIDTMSVEDIDKNSYLSAQDRLLNRYPKIKGKMNKDVLRVEMVSNHACLENITFNLRNEEILGITGSDGSGASQLIHAIFGLNKISQGKIYVNNRLVSINSPHDALSLGISYIGGTNYKQYLLDRFDIKNNISLSNLNRVSNKYFLSDNIENEVVGRLLNKLGINHNVSSKTNNLTVGEQKKVILAKGIFAHSKIFILDKITCDLDVVSKVDIYNIMNELIHSGVSFILHSNDIEELKGMCDRIVFMDKGKISKIISREEFAP